MTNAARSAGTIAAVCLMAATACRSDGDDTTSESVPTAAPATAVEESVDEPTATEPSETAPSTDAPTTEPSETTEPELDEVSETTAPDDEQLLDFEFQPVPAGRYRVETIGAPFVIDVPEGWWVQPNSFGHFVLTDEDSNAPGDRDIVMIRPSNLADPDQPSAPTEEQTGDWPLADITGWVDALVPGVVTGEPVDTVVGGLEAVQFDVAVSDEVGCGDGFCVGFATNRSVNNLSFEPGSDYRVWWVDGGDDAPIAISVGAGSDPEFMDRAQAVLDTVTFESIGPNPIPSEGNLWEVGAPSDVPAGTVRLPVGPGVTFEMSDSHFIQQREFFANVFLDAPGEADILFPNQAFDGEPVATVEDVIDGFERDPEVTATVVGTREVAGFEATEIDVSGPAFGPDLPAPSLVRSDQPDSGWIAPPDGAVWVMLTPDGVVVITAEWFEPGAMGPAAALATEILDSIVIGG